MHKRQRRARWEKRSCIVCWDKEGCAMHQTSKTTQSYTVGVLSEILNNGELVTENRWRAGWPGKSSCRLDCIILRKNQETAATINETHLMQLSSRAHRQQSGRKSCDDQNRSEICRLFADVLFDGFSFMLHGCDGWTFVWQTVDALVCNSAPTASFHVTSLKLRASCNQIYIV